MRVADLAGGAMNILLVEDDPGIGRFVHRGLMAEGYMVEWQTSGRRARPRLASGLFHAAILDLGLPDMDGADLCRELRQDGVDLPICMLTARASLDEKLEGFRCGADDYLTKPFRTQELLARIRTALRNKAMVNNELAVTFGNCSVDFTSRIVKANNEIIKLTATEYNLLALLIKNDGRVLTHQYILKEIWGQSYADQTQYLRVFVAQLRKKIEEDANRPKFIITESGVGYRFNSG